MAPPGCPLSGWPLSTHPTSPSPSYPVAHKEMLNCKDPSLEKKFLVIKQGRCCWWKNPADIPNYFSLVLLLYVKGWEVKVLAFPASLAAIYGHMTWFWAMRHRQGILEKLFISSWKGQSRTCPFFPFLLPLPPIWDVGMMARATAAILQERGWEMSLTSFIHSFILWIGSICLFTGCKYSHHGWIQASNLISLTAES